MEIEKNKGKLRKHHIKTLRKNQHTMCAQLKDIDLKINDIHSVLMKLDISELLTKLVAQAEIIENLHFHIEHRRKQMVKNQSPPSTGATVREQSSRHNQMST